MSEYSKLNELITNYIKKADNDFISKLKALGFTESDYIGKTINEIEDKISEILEKESDFFIEKLRKEGIIYNETLFFDEDLTDELIKQLFNNKFNEFCGNSVKIFMSELDTDMTFNTFSARTTGWISSWSEELGDLVKVESHNSLQKIINDGLKNGLGIEKVAINLKESYGFSRKRARKIALTETLTAHSVSNQEAFLQSPVVTHKKWRHTGARKNNPRQNHININNQVVGKDKPFKLAGKDGEVHEPMYPRDTKLPPTERVNCHCILQSVTSSEVGKLSHDKKNKIRSKQIADDNVDFYNKNRNNITYKKYFELLEDKADKLYNKGTTRDKAIRYLREFVSNPSLEYLGKVESFKHEDIIEKLEQFEDSIRHEKIENAIVITKDGNIFKCLGTENQVPVDELLSDRLNGAYITHNHPKEYTEFSFSKEDFAMFEFYNLSTLRGIDEKYIYELNRTNTVDTSDSEFLANEIIFEQFRHTINIEKAQERGLGYWRKKKE